MYKQGGRIKENERIGEVKKEGEREWEKEKAKVVLINVDYIWCFLFSVGQLTLDV